MGAAPRRALSSRFSVVCLALLTPLLLAAAQSPRPPPISIYGVELDAQSGSERVLVFGKAPLTGRLEPRDAKTLVVVIAGAVLDASAPARVTGAPGAAIRSVELAEAAGADGPEVRLEIDHAPGLPIELGSRGATLAIELARPQRAAVRGIPMQYRETELAQIVDELARATGQRFIYDDSLQGRITITSPERVTPEQALELLHSALLLTGFVALPTPSGARKILPLAGGIGQTPVEPLAPGAGSEKQTVTLVRLRAAAPEKVVALLQPWLGTTALAVAHDPSNALILAGSEARLRTLMTLVSEIDRASDEELVIRRLRHRSAADAASLLLAALGEKIGARPAVEAWPDERTGALVLRAPHDEMEDARALLAEIDRPVQGSGGIRVHELRYADPETLAKLLQGLATGETEPTTLAPPTAAPARRPGSGGSCGSRALSLAGREFGVAIFGPVHALVLRGDSETLNLLEELIDELDRPPPMIEVEVLVLQVLNDRSIDLGFDAFIPATRPKNPHDWFVSTLLNPSGGGLLQPGEGSGPAYAARFTRAPLVIPFIDSEGNPTSLIVPRETGVVTVNNALVRTQTLMRPHLRMIAGDEQEIFAGDNIPVPVSKAAAATPTAAGEFQVDQNIERQDVGITLRVKPTVGEAGGVRLELDVDVSTLAPSIAGDVEEVGPSFRNRKLTSTVYLNDNEFIVVGFAREAAYEQSIVGTPWFMNIPILGWAFKAVGDTNVTARLVIAAQARIERTPEERIADSIRQRLAFERSRSRSAPLTAEAGTSWALRVAATNDLSEAQAIAARVSSGARPARARHALESSGGRSSTSPWRASRPSPTPTMPRSSCATRLRPGGRRRAVRSALRQVA